MLRAELESRARHDLVLKRLLSRKARPTADDYGSMNWLGNPAAEMDQEEQEIVLLLKQLEAEPYQ
jgi:hypothetical protein